MFKTFTVPESTKMAGGQIMPLFDEVRFFNERSLIFNKKFTSLPVRVTNTTMRAENNASGFAILKGKEWQYPL